MDVSQLPQCSAQITLEPLVGRHRPEASETDALANSVQIRCHLMPASPASTESFTQGIIECLFWLWEALDLLRPGGNPKPVVTECCSEGASKGVSICKRPRLGLSHRYDGNAVSVAQLLLLPDQLDCRLHTLPPRSAAVTVRVSMDEQNMEGTDITTRGFENLGCPAPSSILSGDTEFSNTSDFYYAICKREA